MNIDISNAHCGPRIQFPDHAWLRVVLIKAHCLRRRAHAARRRAPCRHARVSRQRARARRAALRARTPYGVRAIVGRSPPCTRERVFRLSYERDRAQGSRDRSSLLPRRESASDCRSSAPLFARSSPGASSEMTEGNVTERRAPLSPMSRARAPRGVGAAPPGDHRTAIAVSVVSRSCGAPSTPGVSSYARQRDGERAHIGSSRRAGRVSESTKKSFIRFARRARGSAARRG